MLVKQGNALVAILAEVDAAADVGYYIIIYIAFKNLSRFPFSFKNWKIVLIASSMVER